MSALVAMLDLLIVIAFVVYSVANGLRARRLASRGLGDYFLAGRTLPGWKAGVSMAATQFAADTPLLFAGLIATGGVFLLWRLWIYGAAFLLMAFVFAVGWRRSGVLTDAEFTEIRYSGRAVLFLRVVKAFYYGTVINCVIMAMVLVAAMRIAEVFLPWHQWLPAVVYGPIHHAVQAAGIDFGQSVTGLDRSTAATNDLISIVAMVAFTATYSMTGGLRSVVATDVVQFALAMLGTLAYAVAVLWKAGGIGALTHRLVAIYGPAHATTMLSFWPRGGEALLPFLVVISLQWLFQMNSDGTGYLAQRLMACHDDREARAAGIVFTWVQIVARTLIWLVIGVGLLVVYPFSHAEAAGPGFAAHREVLFVTGINDMLPVGVRGIMLTGMLAALASTIDTHLNWGASYWSNDIYQRLICRRWIRREPSGAELVVVARLSNLVVLVIALVVMSNLGSIQKGWFVSLLFGAGMGSVLVLRWLWERVNLYSEVAAIAASLVVAPILLVATDQEWIRLGVMSLVSTAAVIAATLLTRPTSREVLRAFYERVRPVGFWGRTAAAAGDPSAAPRRELARLLRGTAVASASLFLVLVGLGKIVVRMPGDGVVAPAVVAAVGVALVPAWRRALRWREASGPEGSIPEGASRSPASGRPTSSP